MPLYEYQCSQCGRFELIRKFSDAALTSCPTCGRDVQKLFSAPAIQFKGSGWYITDYARKGAKSDGAESGESKETSAKEASTKEASASKAASSATSAGGASKDSSTGGNNPRKSRSSSRS